LTFSRKSQQEKLPLKIAPVIKEVLKMMRSSIPATIEIRENIVSEATVIADPTKVHQVTMNLCTNAYHAMREDGGVLTVALDDVEIVKPDDIPSLTMVPGKYVRLTVTDTGHGMGEDVLGKIFEPYFTTKRQDEGTGLGLAVVLGIVQEHRGYTSVQSQVNEGTQFVVYFPTTDKKGETAPSREEEALDAEGNETILVVDDEAEILSVTKVFLEQYGYRVVAFQDGVKALQAFEQDPDAFDLVITDMTMPKITGDKLAARMMAIRPDLPVILTTGYSQKISREEALRLGIRRYIEKPVVLRDLVIAVRKNLDGL
jgi:CheY-like chemotaxis protein